jgi:hypothetical protein
VSKTIAAELAASFKQLIVKGKCNEGEFEKVLQAEFKKIMEKVTAEIGRKS